uniref:Uncharacterized protein n=1 Tax=Anguilla anguilla TaxID=7936 RepID=A0A0E9QYR4_ANGAN
MLNMKRYNSSNHKRGRFHLNFIFSNNKNDSEK